jgi:hypothetical protein
MSWILLSEDGEVVVRNNTQPMRIVVRPGLYPTVVCGTNHFYPSSWEGFVTNTGEITKWNYPSGPVREIRVEKGSGDNIWVMVVWR